MKNQEYNGWTNYETWNVSLYIQNDYGFYCAAKRISENYDSNEYKTFLEHYIVNENGTTPDGVAWNDPKLDTKELNEMIKEFTR